MKEILQKLKEWENFPGRGGKRLKSMQIKEIEDFAKVRYVFGM